MALNCALLGSLELQEQPDNRVAVSVRTGTRSCRAPSTGTPAQPFCPESTGALRRPVSGALEELTDNRTWQRGLGVAQCLGGDGTATSAVAAGEANCAGGNM